MTHIEVQKEASEGSLRTAALQILTMTVNNKVVCSMGPP